MLIAHRGYAGQLLLQKHQKGGIGFHKITQMICAVRY